MHFRDAFRITCLALAMLLQPSAASAWGALAVGDGGRLGYSNDHPTKAEAEAAAVEYCRESTCSPRATFQSTCVATAFMQSGARAEFTWATGPYPEQLQQQVDIICRNAEALGWERCVPADAFCTN